VDRSTEAFQLLGLARRAGALALGTDAARRAVREGRAHLVVMAGDASPVQLRKIEGLLEHRPVPRAVLGDRSRLGEAVGGPPLAALAVTGPDFAARLLGCLTNDEAEPVPGLRSEDET
jgi:ribosomal protein L7Ae-like RNA K-turn-binding protein